ncbi:MAG TPA: CocE/NonD family hydrolase [Acidimicrobiia bacterium]|nr:CocE/NonD family hydrolase [Acidimicrobiia bacterium]
MPPRASVHVAVLVAVLVTGATVAAQGVSPRATAATVTFQVQGSVEQVAVTGAPKGATARLLDASGHTVARRAIDGEGATLFRHVHPGRHTVTVGGARSRPVAVTSVDDVPPQSLYSSQRLGPGFGYIRTRDGTLLSADVVLPGPVADGPYPTVVEYSGYDPSNPDGHQPASTLAQLLGFATVGVNLRGTGCSGGAFDYFEPLQSLDGYDAIETVAAQPWVAHGKVGMVGISYPGLTQLFVAATRPPHLAAITPLSVTDDTYQTLYPGGILNNGFAVGWADDRQADAEPSASDWARRRIADGDTTCADNQALRLQSPSVSREITALGRNPEPADDALAPARFVHKIDVPVFLAGSWQDEETGGHWPEMLDQFAPGVVVKATLTNGIHADSLGPEVITRWAEFLDFYVARRVPSISPSVRAIASAALAGTFGDGTELPPDRFAPGTDYATALAAYQAEPPVRVLFDSGAGGPEGAPIAAMEASFPSWPPPATTATTWYLAAGGRLEPTAPAPATSDHYVYDPGAFPRTDAPAGDEGSEQAKATKLDWKPVPAGKALGYVTAPLGADTVILGSGSVDLWLRSTAPDVDLEVTVSEVRPDGEETYVQSGWLRASKRALDPAASTDLHPVPTYRASDTRPLPKGRYSLVRVPLFPFGHVFRAGSRIRIVVQPPGGNRPAWAFDALTYHHEVVNDVAVGGDHPSRVVLPVVPGIPVTTPLPECGSLRGQPCRAYVAPSNATGTKGSR